MSDAAIIVAAICACATSCVVPWLAYLTLRLKARLDEVHQNTNSAAASREADAYARGRAAGLAAGRGSERLQ